MHRRLGADRRRVTPESLGTRAEGFGRLFDFDFFFFLALNLKDRHQRVPMSEKRCSGEGKNLSAKLLPGSSDVLHAREI